MADRALFRRLGPCRFEPTGAAVSAWDPDIVHGSAIAALLAGRLAPAEGTLARLTIELLAPVPMQALDLERDGLAGGTRVQREHARLSHDGRVVAAAHAVVVRRGSLDLPERARQHPSPFDPAGRPSLDGPNRAVADYVGHGSFDSRSVVVAPMKVDGDRRVHLWVSLTLPPVEGEPIAGIETAAVAADYAQYAVNAQLPFTEWSFRNAEQTLHLARAPIGPWVGMRCESVVDGVGAGFNTSDLFDECGRFGHSAASIVVEHR